MIGSGDSVGAWRVFLAGGRSLPTLGTILGSHNLTSKWVQWRITAASANPLGFVSGSADTSDFQQVKICFEGNGYQATDIPQVIYMLGKNSPKAKS